MANLNRRGVLFLCTGNSARSLMAEAILARRGGDRFRSMSAGSQPKAAPHPTTITTLERLGYPTAELRSKSWDEFSAPASPRVDLVLTVCGNAANETCPVWPGHPVSAHWGVEDPAAFEGSPEQESEFFETIHDQLALRVDAFLTLPVEELSRDELTQRVRAIGRTLPS